jgi:isoprenylcysteine carboxyl methyltransferase (ICMT) family protein YpbQ
MSSIAYAIIGAVVVQRFMELAWVRRNTKRLKAQGVVEVGARHCPLLNVPWNNSHLRSRHESSRL